MMKDLGLRVDGIEFIILRVSMFWAETAPGSGIKGLGCCFRIVLEM